MPRIASGTLSQRWHEVNSSSSRPEPEPIHNLLFLIRESTRLAVLDADQIPPASVRHCAASESIAAPLGLGKAKVSFAPTARIPSFEG